MHKDIYRATHCTFIRKKSRTLCCAPVVKLNEIVAKPHRSEYNTDTYRERDKITTKNCTL